MVRDLLHKDPSLEQAKNELCRGWLSGFRVLVAAGRSPVSYSQWLVDAGAKVTAAASCANAIQLASTMPSGFDAAVVEANLPDGCGVAIAEDLRAREPCCRIVIIAHWMADPGLSRVRDIPGATMLSSRTTAPELVFAVQDAAACTPLGLRRVLKRVGDKTKLSRQQERLFWLNLWGYSDREIADALGIQLHTAQDYQMALRRKTGVRSKAGYLRLLLEVQGVRAPINS